MAQDRNYQQMQIQLPKFPDDSCGTQYRHGAAQYKLQTHRIVRVGGISEDHPVHGKVT